MTDYIPEPTIKTVCKDSRYDFTLIIYAYRKLSEAEARNVYHRYLAQNHLKHPPKGKIVEAKTLYGYNLE